MSEDIALMLAAGLLALAGLFYWRFARQQQRINRTVNQRLLEIAEQLRQTRTRVEALESRPPMESALDRQSVTYADAVRLARTGINAKELADQLGISMTEADLIIAVTTVET